MSSRTIHRANRIEGEITVPGDKSISHRALLLGALCDGGVEIENRSPGGDVASTADCLRLLGVEISGNKVVGKGMNGLKSSGQRLDAGNSGSTIRMLSGILAGQPFESKITGDESIQKRDMKRIIEPLLSMGAKIGSNHGRAPLAIIGGNLKGIDYRLPVASAQVKSAILFASLFASGETAIMEPAPTRDHTERLFQDFGIPIQKNGNKINLTGSIKRIEPKKIVVPGDPSSAAFFIAAATLVPGSNLKIKNIGINPTRTGFIDTVKKMGGKIEFQNSHTVNLEPRADLVVQSASLHGIEVGGSDIPLLIDEIPILAVLATQAKGKTVIKDAKELRGKESDRILAIAINLKAMGADVTERPDGLEISGPTLLHGAAIQSFHDHRIILSFSVAGLIADGETILKDAEWADISFPGFFKILSETL